MIWRLGWRLQKGDKILAQHYGFTDEELDFIPSASLRTGINYDIKYPQRIEIFKIGYRTALTSEVVTGKIKVI